MNRFIHEVAIPPLVDTRTGQLSTTCWQMNTESWSLIGAISIPPFLIPRWSPGSQQLLVVNWPENADPDIYLLDLELGFVTLFVENALPIGWLAPKSTGLRHLALSW